MTQNESAEAVKALGEKMLAEGNDYEAAILFALSGSIYMGRPVLEELSGIMVAFSEQMLNRIDTIKKSHLN